ncbi:MAG: glycosyltransferase family 2 protein [Lachnospiraceae bacterium]|nr:glycosyltransferase family 2 protein [Lachnospiraceae bacterium]
MKHCYAISAYGASPYLETCIESLTQQSVRSAVILCTSTPNDLIREMAARYAIPLYIRDGASSLHADWNFAVETAVRETGAELVTVAHQDDVYHRDYGKALRAAWHMYPDLSVFCTRYRTIDAGGEPVTGRAERVKRLLRLPLRMRELADRTFVKRSVLQFGNAIGCPTCTYAVEKTGLPLFQNDYHFVIDWDTLLRISRLPGRFVCLERELLDYRVHDGAETLKNIENHVREKEEQLMFEKMWPQPFPRILMHFYRRACGAYTSEKKTDGPA